MAEQLVDPTNDPRAKDPRKMGNVRVYQAPDKKPTPIWLWLLPLLALVGLGMWWYSRPHDRSTVAERDPAIPATQGVPKTDTPEDIDRMRTMGPVTAASVANLLMRTGRVSLSDSEIHFNEGGSRLDQNSKTLLNSVATAMQDHRDWNLLVVGHADAQGSAGGNETIAQQRAQIVADYLTTQGVERSRLRMGAMGDRQPTASNAATSGRAENGRVDLIKE